MVSSEPASPPRVSRRWPLISAGVALGVVVLLALVIVYRESNKPFGFEIEWMSEIVEHRAAFWTAVALVFNYLGGGITAILVVPLATILGLLLWRRPWAALYYACSVIAAVIVVQVLKNVIGRPRPTDILVHPDFGSFPSGHSANAAVIATTLGIIFWRTWVWALGAVYTIAMMFSRTYLGAHWISDTVGGILVGAGVAVIIWAPLANRLAREHDAPHPPIWRAIDA
jgi:membrane-associated phospholipid phosphatase